jgi:hypothetical protein
MIALPAAMPITTPVAETVATPVAADVHTPPGIAAESDTELPVQIAVTPAILPADGGPEMVIVLVVCMAPQLLAVVYVKIAIPVAIGTTTPLAETDAYAPPPDQLPPVTEDTKLPEPPIQIVSGPDMAPAIGSGFTVTTAVVLLEPHTSDME